MRRKPSEEITTILARGVINRRVSRLLLCKEQLEGFVSMLESAWEPSNSLELDSVHPIK